MSVYLPPADDVKTVSNFTEPRDEDESLDRIKGDDEHSTFNLNHPDFLYGTIHTRVDFARTGQTDQDESLPAPRQHSGVGSVALSPRQPEQPVAQPPQHKTDPKALLLIRAHFLSHICELLVELEQHAKTPDAIAYAGPLLFWMSSFVNQSPDDPLTEVLASLYPSMWHENEWSEWGAEKFRELRTCLTSLSHRKNLAPRDIDKALGKLEMKLGVDPFPYEVEMDEDFE